MKYSAILAVLLMAIIAMLPNGCAKPRQQTEETSSQIEPTLAAESVVYYYKSDGSSYITDQTHGYDPDAGYFEMFAAEPSGRIHCSLTRGKFVSSDKNPAPLSDLPDSFFSRNLATAVFYSFCAGADLIDTASLTALGDAEKIEGQWYTPLRPAWPNSPLLTLYRSLDTQRVEWVRLQDEGRGFIWLLRSYNLRYSSELDKQLPRMIDVFNIENGLASKELMIRFDYKDVRKVPAPAHF